MKKLLIDYGATRCRYLLTGGSREEEQELPSTSITLYDLVEKLLKEESGIGEVAISYAGQIKEGMILSAPNIGEKQMPIKELIEKKYGVTLAIENDLKCAALAEYHERQNAGTLFAAYIGTGFGGAFVEDGRLFRGTGNLAGEIGHIPFKKAPLLCGCGKDDCVEIYCSGSGLKKWVAYYGLECEATLAALEACRDENAETVLQNFYEALSYALSAMVTLINPKYLILGGSVVVNNPGLGEYVKESVGRIAFGASAQALTIEITTMKNGCLEGTRWI